MTSFADQAKLSGSLVRPRRRLKEAGRIDEALVCFNEALSISPLIRMRATTGWRASSQGRLTEGFEDFESRWTVQCAARPFIKGRRNEWRKSPRQAHHRMG